MPEIYTKEEIILKIKAIDKQIEKSMGMASYNFEARLFLKSLKLSLFMALNINFYIYRIRFVVIARSY